MADEQKPKTKPVAARQDRVRLTLLVYRKQGMSLDEFQKYWKDEHSQVFSSIAIVKKNLLTYVQVREASIPCFRSVTSQGLIYGTLSLQAHVNEEVSKLRLGSFPVYAPKDLLREKRFSRGPTVQCLVLKMILLTRRPCVGFGTIEASRLPCL